MLFDLNQEFLLRLCLAILLGGAIGLEREIKRKTAGLRTIMLICIGSTLFTHLSEQMGTRYGGDPLRIASQLIPGIGFIGAGAILRERGSVIGLTTAALIFVTASIGMAIGAGFYGTAIATTVTVLVLLIIAGWGEARFTPRFPRENENHSENE